jgi:hypothetical protein
MLLVQDDHVVQAVAAETPGQPLDVRILPRTSGAIKTSSIPICWTRCRKAVPWVRSRSRRRYRRASSHGKASMTGWAVHSAVGCSVTLKWTTRRQ